MIVEDAQVGHAQSSVRSIKVDLDGTVLHRNHPEDVVAVNMRVVVVNLLNETGRSNRTGVQIKSNKGERGMMLLSVRTDKSSLTEPHVSLKGQRSSGASHRVCSCPAAANVCQTYESIEVCDLRRIVDVRQRVCGIQRIVVNKDSVGLECGDAPRNWIRADARGGFLVV